MVTRVNQLNDMCTPCRLIRLVIFLKFWSQSLCCRFSRLIETCKLSCRQLLIAQGRCPHWLSPHTFHLCFCDVAAQALFKKVLVWFGLDWGFTSQSTIFQSCRDRVTASWVLPVLFGEVNVSCSRIQHGDLSEDRTPDLWLRNPTLYH